ncbi:MAG TPA: DUF445 domain-containing protein [Candidatus Binatia bacterium]|nr:DUF445 domain-containing protein [Candidatus Binatia bacterium]
MRRSRVGAVSLGAAAAGAAVCHVGLVGGPFAGAAWLRIVTAGFEAALVGGLADWFAVTALFRHPLGLPIPHTAIIPRRRARIVDGIVAMVEDEWLSPEVIGARLARLAPSAAVVDWLRDPEHVARLGGPVRDLLRALARLLSDDDVAGFVDHTLRRELREAPLDAAGAALARWAAGDGGGRAFAAAAHSLANLAARPRTPAELQWWLERSARALRTRGRRLLPFVLRRRVVQRAIVEAACDWAETELRAAADDPAHPLRRAVLDSVGRFADRLVAGDGAARAQAARLRAALIESLEAGPLVRDVLARLRAQLEGDLDDPTSALSTLVDRRARAGVLELLNDPARRAAFDRWVRDLAETLLRRHHDQIGLTVRENLEALETGRLVAQIEARVGPDLQFIRLNGAIVGGLVGLLLAVARWLAG